VSMLGHGTAPGGGRVEPDRGPMTAATRAIASRHEVVHADTMGSTVVTAEIPSVPLHPRSYGVLLPDGSVWYPGSKKRLPAPWPLRFVVWVLSLMLLLMLGGLAVVEWHPSWLASLRHTVGSAPTVGLGGAPGTATTQPGQTTTPTQLDQWSCTPGATSETCALGVSTYTLDFITTGRCDVQITSSSSQQNIYVGVQPGNETQTFRVTGGSTVLAYAGGASVKIYNGSTLIGQIPTVKYDYAYTFEPASDVTGATSAPSST
jgi:hypothetical protein